MDTATTNHAAILLSPKAALVVSERPVPTPGPGEIVVRNSAIAVNPVDWKRRDWEFNISSYPAVLGADISGIVFSVGLSVTGFNPGDRVAAWADAFVTHNADRGAYQTYTIVKANSATLLPAHLSLSQGSTFPSGISTSAMIFFDFLKFPLLEIGKPDLPTSNETILIWGGASAVGWHAIQLARKLGLNVATTASTKHHQMLRALGASILVDYHSLTVVDELISATKEAGKPFTYGIDCVVSPETLVPIKEVLAKSSTRETKRLVTTLPWPESVPAISNDIEYDQVHGEEMWTRREDLCAWLYGEALPKWLERGELISMPYRVIEGGLAGLEEAMGEVKNGVSGEKIMVELQ